MEPTSDAELFHWIEVIRLTSALGLLSVTTYLIYAFCNRSKCNIYVAGVFAIILILIAMNLTNTITLITLYNNGSRDLYNYITTAILNFYVGFTLILVYFAIGYMINLRLDLEDKAT